MEFSRQEHWSGLSFPTPEDLPDLGIEPMSLASPALAGRFFTTSTTWEAPIYYYFSFVLEMNFSSVQSLSRNEFTGMNLSCTTISLVFIIQSFFLGSVQFSSVHFSSVAQLCQTLCDPMNHSTAGLPVHHQLPEFTQIHVHRVSNAIHPSHPHVQKTEEWSSVCKVCVRRATNWSFFCTQ